MPVGDGEGGAERDGQHGSGDLRKRPTAASRRGAREPAPGERKQQALDEEPGLEHGEVAQRREVLLRSRQRLGQLTAECTPAA